MAFAVACAAPGPITGTLQIVTVTTGPSQDANGYLISIDGGPGQPIGTSATVTLSNVTAVLHTIELQGLAPNCGITGDNPLGAAVGAGETARVSFSGYVCRYGWLASNHCYRAASRRSGRDYGVGTGRALARQ